MRINPDFELCELEKSGGNRVDHSGMKLGASLLRFGLPPESHPSIPCLARYLDSTLPAPPSIISWASLVSPDDWGMLLNDTLGDCTIAGALHLNQSWGASAGGIFVPTNAMALEGYERIDGYVPGNPSTDQGGDMGNVLDQWKAQGIGGRKIFGYVSVDPRNDTEVRQAIALFGGVYAAVSLPVSAQTQKTWWNASPNDGGVWGGHCVPVLDYDDTKHTLDCVTWGAVKTMTRSFFRRYFVGCFAVVSQDFIKVNSEAPSGFDLAQLLADLSELPQAA